MKSSFFFCTFSFLNISYRHSFRSVQPLERKTHSKIKSEVAAEIRNEYEEENEDLKERLRFSIASVYSEKERDAYHSFVTKHLTCRQNKIDSGKLPWIKQVSTGIGIATTIRCPVCGEQEDITDTSVW